MLKGLTFRQNYFDDPAGLRGLTDLLQDIFGIDIGLLQQFGGLDPSSMPFGYFDDAGRCVANFSAFSMPLIVNGKMIRATGYQSGAVRPEFRGQGLYRDLMQRAFAWAHASGSNVGLLLTKEPSLYEKFGFHTLPQHKFCGPTPEFRPIEGEVRHLNLQTRADVVIIDSLLSNRQPVSNRFSIVRQTEMFFFNAECDPPITLSLIPKLNAVIAWKLTEDAGLMLLDIAAPQIPPLSAILSCLNVPAGRVEVCFPTDRLGWEGQPVAYDGACSLMSSGMAHETIMEPFMLSPMAEF
ncbi:GNAT family N-acetyltransferase [Rhizobium sp.]|jgi:GNAT superfamily N-acetyltransferase|uniref:GNAT family N-acetyltransferase n=1 Tax=Rhizobium sp. TaxID=391 RepID=UPI000E90E6CA|nr:GNAT family N-acetyltransferase [Rhizobium sp.]